MYALRYAVCMRYVNGLALSASIAAVTIWAASFPIIQHWGLSALTLAILTGILLGNSVFPSVSSSFSEGVDFSKNKLLRLGIILYGFRITFQQIAELGWAGIAIDAIIVICTFTLAVQLGTRVFKLDLQTAMLIGAGSSICGAAAVMATAPVVRGSAHKVSVAVATVVVFGTVAMFIYPLAYPYLGMSELMYGRYVGSTIHEVAQVVAAGKAIGNQAASVAVIEKMLRVMMLAPFLILLSNRSEGNEKPRKTGVAETVPWFAVLFIVAAGVNSLSLLPVKAISAIVHADNVLLAMAMGALGLRTHVSAIRRAGLKPIMLAGILFVFLMVGGFFINRAMGALM